MNVLILTPIGPYRTNILIDEIYKRFLNSRDDVSLHMFPYYAFAISAAEGREYLPAYFSIIQTYFKEEVYSKYRGDINIFVGNTYKNDRYDLIVGFVDKIIVDKNFDNYLDSLYEYPELAEAFRVNEMYSLDDAEIILPTVEHVIKFIESTIKK